MALDTVKYFKIGLLVVLLSTLLIDIVSGAIIWIRDGNSRPFADATIGQSFAADTFIYKSVKILRDDNLIKEKQLTNEYLNYLREQIFISLFIIITMIYLLSRLFKKLFGMYSEEFWGGILVWVITIAVYLIISTVYVLWQQQSLDNNIKAIELIPVKGVGIFFKNIIFQDASIFTNSGIEENLLFRTQTNNLIQNATNTTVT